MLARSRTQVGEKTSSQKRKKLHVSYLKKIKQNSEKKNKREKSLFDPGRHFPVPYLLCRDERFEDDIRCERRALTGLCIGDDVVLVDENGDVFSASHS